VTPPEKLCDAITRPERSRGRPVILSGLKSLLETGRALPKFDMSKQAGRASFVLTLILDLSYCQGRLSR